METKDKKTIIFPKQKVLQENYDVYAAWNKAFEEDKEVLSYGLYSYMILDSIAEEYLVFGDIKYGEEVPIEKYMHDAGYEFLTKLIIHKRLHGKFLKEDRMNSHACDTVYFEFYAKKINAMFFGLDTYDDKEAAERGMNDAMEHYKFGIYEYSMQLYKFFRKIIKTENIYADFNKNRKNVFGLDEAERQRYHELYEKLNRLITDIFIKNIEKGCNVDEYLLDLPYIPYYVNRLVKKKGKHYFLIDDNVHGIDYKLALFNTFHFYVEEHTYAFELKMKSWESRHRNKFRSLHQA